MTTVRCPICRKEMRVERVNDWPSLPFCSARCRTVDLGRWLSGEYRIPTPAADSEDEPPIPDETSP